MDRRWRDRHDLLKHVTILAINQTHKVMILNSLTVQLEFIKIKKLIKFNDFEVIFTI